MIRVSIKLESITSSVWEAAYQFMTRVQEKRFDEIDLDDFQHRIGLMYISTVRTERPNIVRGTAIQLDNLVHVDFDQLVFSFFYGKKDSRNDVSDLVKYVLIERLFPGQTTLCIILPQKNNGGYYYRCRQFFRFYPYSTKDFIYFKEGGKTKALFGEENPQNDQSINTEDVSQKFIPLIPVQTNVYKELFGVGKNIETDSGLYVHESNSKLEKTLHIDEKKRVSPLFRSWFFNACLNALDGRESLSKEVLGGIINTLSVYYRNIYELIQNIVFHGGCNGYTYFTLKKREDFGEELKGLTGTVECSRYLEIGVFDFGQMGIVDTFLQMSKNLSEEEKDSISLNNFFDDSVFITSSLSKLDLRYSANLGIKSFVSSVRSHNGYFSVESCSSPFGKDRIVYCPDTENGYIYKEEKTEFAPGTFYTIVLPLVPTISSSPEVTTSQKLSFKDELCARLADNIPRIPVFSLASIDLNRIEYNKKQQVQLIKRTGEKVLSQFAGSRQLAIDIGGTTLIENTPEFLYKLLAYIQLSSKTPIQTIVVIGLSEPQMESLCDVIRRFLLCQDIPVWSNESAVILMTDSLHYQILCGEKADTIRFLNEEYSKHYYPQTNLFEPSSISSDDTGAIRFVLPYELLLDKPIKDGVFTRYAKSVLNRPIEDQGMGYLVDTVYTYIGSKLIIKSFYEADTLFLNSFFAERFAFQIAESFLHSSSFQTFDSVDTQKKKKTLTIVGYKPYSELLVNMIDSFLTKSKKVKQAKVVIVDEQQGQREQLFFSPSSLSKDDYYLVVVPIGSTLSTNYKIADTICRVLELKGGPTKAQFVQNNLIYTHCAIIVRDQEKMTETTDYEVEQQWKKNSILRGNYADSVETEYVSANKVYFSIDVASAKSPQNWWRRLNTEISFRDKWSEEEYVNSTENSSVNSQNLLGLPTVWYGSHSQGYNFEKESDRLYKLKPYTYFGHISGRHSHYRYYIDVESFVRDQATIKEEENSSLRMWMGSVKRALEVNSTPVHILISPNPIVRTDLIRMVNETIFSGNALILCLDVNNRRDNIVYKFSYLNEYFNNSSISPCIHYVDYTLYTGETYFKAKSYLSSILKENFHGFDSMIVVANRLSHNRFNEIQRDIDSDPNRIFAYVNFYIPPIVDQDQSCSLCLLNSYYRRIKSLTSLESCKHVISKNSNRISVTNFDYTSGREEGEGVRRQENIRSAETRQMCRMLLTHEIYYRLSMVQESVPAEGLEKKVYDELKELLNGEWDGWLDPDHRITRELPPDLDKYWVKHLSNYRAIAFLKVLSSPPLSQYILIRKFAHSFLLEELKSLFSIPNPRYIDAKLLRVTLKGLSMMKSNALVRKEVIESSLKLFREALGQITDEMSLIIRLSEAGQGIMNQGLPDAVKEDFGMLLHAYKLDNTMEGWKRERFSHYRELLHFYIKNASVDDEAKSLFLGNLLRTGVEMQFPVTEGGQVIKKTDAEIGFLHKNDKGQDDPEIKLLYDWLFYDNTTIIRNTLDKFEYDLGKDAELQSRFIDNKTKELIDFSVFHKNIQQTRKLFVNLINNEYYYRVFRDYLDNGDGYDLLGKMLYLLYAKKLLVRLNDEHGKKHIVSDTKVLISVFTHIMDADVGFIAMKGEKKINGSVVQKKEYVKDYRDYVIAFVNTNEDLNLPQRWDYNVWQYNESFVSWKVLTQDGSEFQRFDLPLYSIDMESPEMSKYREHGLFNAAHQEILLIYDSSKTTDERNELVAVIPFIYAKQRERSDSEKQVYTKENARLIIMLKDELDKYFIAYLRDGKHYELWLEEQKSHELYTKPDHHFNHEIDNLMDELSNVDENGNPSIDIDRIKWHLSGLSRNKEIRRFLIEDVAAHDLTTIDVGRALKTYCTYILPPFLQKYITYDFDEDPPILLDVNEAVFVEVFSEYLRNIRKTLNTILPETCRELPSVCLTVKKENDEVIIILKNNFFLSDEREKHIPEINSVGCVTGEGGKEKGLSLNKRLLKKIGAEVDVNSIVIDKSRFLGEFTVEVKLKS